MTTQLQIRFQNYQFDQKYHPHNWKPLNECTYDFMDFNNTSRPGSDEVSDFDIMVMTLNHLMNGYKDMLDNSSFDGISVHITPQVNKYFSPTSKRLKVDKSI